MLFRFVGNTERHAKLRITMSADRSIRKGSSQTLKAITNQNGRVETILEQRVEWCNINGRCAHEAVTATVNETWLILQSLLILMPMLTELVSSSLERKKRKA